MSHSLHGTRRYVLSTAADLEDWYARFGYTGRRRGDARELDEVRALRPMLRDLLTADRDRAATIVNQVLAQAGALPQLVRHGVFDWHLHAVSPDASLALRVRVETAMAMVDVIRSTRCSNRSSVAAYRSRRAARG